MDFKKVAGPSIDTLYVRPEGYYLPWYDEQRQRTRPDTGPLRFVFHLSVVFFRFAMAKAIVPRYRYDQLMRTGWKLFLPLSLIMVVIVAFVLQLNGWGWHGGMA